VFLEAQNEILGGEHAYPMITFGTMKSSGAWKMYARATGIDFNTANVVSDQIKEYEKSLRYADEEEKEFISIYQFIDSKYHKIYDESTKYLNLVNSLSIHPCASLLMNKNLKEEFGLIRIKSTASGSDNLCVNCDGLFAEKYKMLKNDLLKVDVVDLIYKTYDKINIKPHTIPELIEACKDNEKVWDIYENGYTIGINQFEKDTTSKKGMRYSPKNISELSAFISAIRPGFKSEYSTFEKRQSFSFNVRTLDEIIQTDEFPYSFMLYQENTMAVLAYAGIPIGDTYAIIKNIAKKRYDKVMAVKNQFVKGMTKRLIENESIKKKEADNVAKKTWQVIEDSAFYQFNASHSYSVAGDSLYGAYLKSHYPLEFYSSFMQIMEEKGDKDRLILAKQESQKAFGINFPIFKFGQDNRSITYDTKTNSINMSLRSIKGFGQKVSDDMYDLHQNFNSNQNKSFLNLLIYATDNSLISSKFEDLIKIRYFEEFGKNKKLYRFYEEFTKGKNRYSKTHTDKTKEKRIPELERIWNELENKNFSIYEQVANELSILGEIQTNFPVNKNYAVAIEVDTKYSPRILFQNLSNGDRKEFKVSKKTYNEFPIHKGSILLFKKVNKKNKVKKNEEGNWDKIEDSFDYWLEVYYTMTENDKFLK
jgi:DNA polymerase III alpha subunit